MDNDELRLEIQVQKEFQDRLGVDDQKPVELRLRKIKQEIQLKQEELKQEELKKEKLRQEKLKQKSQRRNELRQEKLIQKRQEELRKEELRQEELRQEELRKEVQRQEELRKEAQALEDQMSYIDSLPEGHMFEGWIANLLKELGYINVKVTPKTGDGGVDVLAEKDEITYAFQCKLYSGNVGVEAVQQIYTAKNYYKRDVRSSYNK